jgi:hypothetical protein
VPRRRRSSAGRPDGSRGRHAPAPGWRAVERGRPSRPSACASTLPCAAELTARRAVVSASRKRRIPVALSALVVPRRAPESRPAEARRVPTPLLAEAARPHRGFDRRPPGPARRFPHAARRPGAAANGSSTPLRRRTPQARTLGGTANNRLTDRRRRPRRSRRPTGSGHRRAPARAARAQTTARPPEGANPEADAAVAGRRGLGSEERSARRARDRTGPQLNPEADREAVAPTAEVWGIGRGAAARAGAAQAQKIQTGGRREAVAPADRSGAHGERSAARAPSTTG